MLHTCVNIVLSSSGTVCIESNKLTLPGADEETPVNGKSLTATHMSAANFLLRSQFPTQNGLQDTSILKQSGI